MEVGGIRVGGAFALAHERGEITYTGEVLKGGSNNDAIMSVPIIKASVASTKADASAKLNQKACETILGMDAGTVRDASRSGPSLVEHAVNLYMLSHIENGAQEPLFIKAREKLKSAANGHAKNGEKSFSTGFIGKGNGHVVHKKIKGLIDKLVSSRPDTFTTAAVVTNRMFLHDGLPSAREQRFGVQLSDQSRKDVSRFGNASDAATSMVLTQLKGAEAEQNGMGLTHFVNTMLNQLDLKSDLKQEKAQSKPAARAHPRDAASDRRQGGGSIGDINVNAYVNVEGLAEIAGVLKQVVDLLADRLLVARNLPSSQAAEVYEGKDVSNPSLSSSSYVLKPSPTPKDIDKDLVRSPASFGLKGGANPLGLKEFGRHKADADVSSESLLTKSDGLKFVSEKDLTSSSPGSADVLDGGRVVKSNPPSFRSSTFELDPERMPKTVPYNNNLFQGIGGRSPDGKFFESVSLGVCGVSKAEADLKAYIRSGADPSMAEPGSTIHGIYGKAKSHSPEFADRLEMLFKRYRELRKLSTSPTPGGEYIGSPGSSSAPAGMMISRLRSISITE